MSSLEDILDELVTKIKNAKKLPLTDMVIVDPEEILNLIDLLRTSLPEALSQAQHLNQQREHIINEAKKEAEIFIESTLEKEEQLVKNTDIVKKAEQKADEILQDANTQAQYYIESTLDWVDCRFKELEQILQKNLEVTAKGREELKRFQEEKIT